MKVVIFGGTGDVGTSLHSFFGAAGHDVVIVSRSAKDGSLVWDGKTLGPWASAVDGADVAVNLAGRSVNCRYNEENLRQMMDSRVDSTRVVGEAIAQAKNPPRIWLQASSATVYRHRYDAPNDELTGLLGEDDAKTPRTWKASVDIVKAWEATLNAAATPNTRKVALRSTLAMTTHKRGIFDALQTLARRGLGGPLGDGRQYVSWIHEADYCAAVQFIIDHEELDGPVNLASPNPLPQAEFARDLRQAVGMPIGLPAMAWMVEIGTWALRTESELVLKSRRVVPTRLLQAGYKFKFPDWKVASRELAQRMKAGD